MSDRDDSSQLYSDEMKRVIGGLHPEATIEGRTAIASFEPQPEHRGNSGWLHGGFAATVLDHTCARAASAALGKRVVTGRLDLRYSHPVLLADGPYRVEATAEEPRGRIVRVSGMIVDQAGRPLVRAQSLFVEFGTSVLD